MNGKNIIEYMEKIKTKSSDHAFTTIMDLQPLSHQRPTADDAAGKFSKSRKCHFQKGPEEEVTIEDHGDEMQIPAEFSNRNVDDVATQCARHQYHNGT